MKAGSGRKIICSGNRWFVIFCWLTMVHCGYPSAENVTDSLNEHNPELKVQKGWNILPLPSIGYDPDLGFQYGVFGTLTYFGDGSYYPDFLHQLYFEFTRYTKGSGTNMLYFDSGKLIHGLRITADVTYLTEQELNFYGFNGYEAVYNRSWENYKPDNPYYKSHVFYAHSRTILRSGLDLRGKFVSEHLSWLAGFTWLNFRISSVNISALRKGSLNPGNFPNVPELYDDYVDWGIIKQNEKNGGLNNFVKLGMVFDSRDNQDFPTRGIWSEIILALAPGFIGDGQFSFAKFSVTHRQYITILRKKLLFAYRLAYQGTIAGKVPFYFQPYMIGSYTGSTTVDGVGGAGSVRGMLRNRVVGDGVAYANAEFRWRFYHFQLMNQAWHLGLIAFTDDGMVLQKIAIDKSGIPANVDQSQFFDGSEYPHLTFGGGVHLDVNENTIFSVDIGHITDRRNGHNGIYVGLGYLF